jgi:ribonuclease E
MINFRLNFRTAMKKSGKAEETRDLEEMTRGRALRRGELRDRPRIEERRGIQERNRNREERRETQERSRNREERRETQERSRNREERRETQERSRNREERRETQERSRNREESPERRQSWYPERTRFTLNLRSESRPIRSQSRRLSPVRSSRYYEGILRLTFIYLF